jgi:serine/threonine protein kinase
LRNGKDLLVLRSSDVTRLLLLKWMHRKSAQHPLAYPFYPLTEKSGKTGSKTIELGLPRDHGEYKTLAQQIERHSNPSDMNHDRTKNPLHLDDVMAIVGQVAKGLELAEQIGLLLKISTESIVALSSRTLGSEFREWDVFINDFSRVSIENDSRTALEVVDVHNLSPEEAKGINATRYSERYRLGILLYALLTRQNPFKALDGQQNWSGLSEKQKVSAQAALLFRRISEQKDPLLAARLKNEPDFAKKDIYSLLKGLLNTSAHERIAPDKVFDRLGWLEKIYITHIDTVFVEEERVYDAGREEYDHPANIVSLGRGGMSRILELDVTSPGTGFRRLKGALKVSTQPRLKESFASEVRLSRSLRGRANIAPVIEGDIHGNLEGFRDGETDPIFRDRRINAERAMGMKRIYDTLDSRDRLRPLSSVEQLYDLLIVFARIAETMQHLHKDGIFHRDIKLANIGFKDASWNPNGVIVLDFGIAVDFRNEEQVQKERADSADGIIKGTPFYMAPEVIRVDGEITIKSDVWSLALCLYEMLSGKRRGDIEATSPMELFAMATHGLIREEVNKTLTKGEIFNGVEELTPGAANGVRQKVVDSLKGLLDSALCDESDIRIDMQQFADRVNYAAEVLDREFRINENRRITRRRRFA